MAVIKRMDLERVEHQAVVLNLGDIAAQGERLRAAARAEAAAIVAQAKAERERLISDAKKVGHEEGLALGRAEGLKKGQADGHAMALAEAREHAKAIEAAWEKGLGEFLAQRNAMLDAAKLDVLKLAIFAAEKLTKRRLELDPTLIGDQMAAAIAEAGRGTGLVVRVAPADVELARGMLPGLMRRFGGGGAEVREDASLARGSCVVSMAGGGMVDASIKTQMQRVAESLLPDATARPSAPGAPGETA